MKAHPGGRRLVFACALALPACTMPLLQPVDIVDTEHTPTDAATENAPAQDPDEQTLALVADGGYQSPANFSHVSRGPYASTAVPGAFVDVWVSSEAYAAYASISPDGGAVDAGIPLGAVIVRAVSDATGAVTKLTLMRHGPSGLDPGDGDWWFAETDPTGNVLSDDAGLLAGPLAECRVCHIARAADDFLFGVMPSAR